MGGSTGGFGRGDRLLRREEFRYLARYGRRVHVGSLLLLMLLREGGSRDERVRLGISVRRQVGKAVVRNRLKRWIREWFRQERADLQPNLDLVVVAERRAAQLSHDELLQALREGVRAVGVVV